MNTTERTEDVAPQRPVDVPWGPAPDGHDLPYWEGLQEGELRIQRCRDCATWIWGPQHICHACHGFDLGWESVAPRGTVYSWSRSWYPYIEELADAVPYVTVSVALDEADERRVLGILVDDESGDPRIGAAVEGFFDDAAVGPWPLLRWRRSATAEAAR